MENPVPTWLSREARVGVKWNCARGLEVVEDDMDIFAALVATMAFMCRS